jgi:DNA anti-recombination protein RmuC
MERKVSKMSGERSLEEQKRLQNEIDTAKAELDKQKKQLDMLVISNKQLVDEKRNIERVIEKVKKQRGTLETQI